MALNGHHGPSKNPYNKEGSTTSVNCAGKVLLQKADALSSRSFAATSTAIEAPTKKFAFVCKQKFEA